MLTPNGAPLNSTIIDVFGSADYAGDVVQIEATNDGGFVVVSTSFTANNLNTGTIKAVKYNATGGAVTSLNVSSNASGLANYPRVTELTDGTLVIIWSDGGQSNAKNHKIVMLDSNMNRIGTEQTIADTLHQQAFGSDGVATVTALPNGGFVFTELYATNNEPAAHRFFSSTLSPISTVGTTGDNTQMGGAGADTLTGGGGADIILAGAGNDTVVINASNISSLTTAGKLLDGGAGVDTLRIGANASTLDLSKSTVQANVQNFGHSIE